MNELFSLSLQQMPVHTHTGDPFSAFKKNPWWKHFSRQAVVKTLDSDRPWWLPNREGSIAQDSDTAWVYAVIEKVTTTDPEKISLISQVNLFVLW